MTASPPNGWREVELRDLLSESDERVGDRVGLPLLSVTKYDGAVLAKDRFSRVLASKDLSRYRVAPMNSIVVDPMLLWDGVIALQHRFADGVVSPDYRVFRFASESDPKFFDYLAHSTAMRRQYARAARGTNVRRRRISRDDFLAIRVVVPPIREQREIAAALGAVDAAVAAAEVLIGQLDHVRRVLQDDLLQRGIPSQSAGRQVSAKMWPVRSLSEIGELQTGLAKGKVPSGPVIEVPYLRVANVQDGFVDLSEVKTIAVDQAAVERYALRQGDVLFTEGGNLDQLGRGCVWAGQIEPCLHQNHVFVVRTGPDVLPGFLAAHAASSRGRAYFLGCAKRTTNLASINSVQLRALPVPIPPVDEQRTIVASLTAMTERIDRERAVVAERRRIKAALADALLAGKVRVSTRDAA